MKKKKILIVDELELNRIMITNILKNDYNVRAVTSGQEAIAILCQEKEDWGVIIVDAAMLNKSGAEFLVNKNKDTEIKEIPIIIISANKEVFLELDRVEFSVYDVICEFTDYEDIKIRVENVLAIQTLENIKKDNILAVETELQRYKVVVDQMKVIVFEWTKVGGIQYISRDTQNYLLPNLEEPTTIAGLLQYIHKDDREIFINFVKVLKIGKTNQATFRLKKCDGLYYYSNVRMHALGDQFIDCVIGTIKDVDKEVKLEMELEFKVTYDPLTSFFNKLTFEEKVAEYIKLHREEKLAIINLDINGFNSINDLFGIKEGDRLLKSIGTVIANLELSIYSCRSNEDSFFLFLKYLVEDEVVKVAKKLALHLESITSKYKLMFNFGIKFISEKQISVKELCDNAVLACSTSKDNILERIGIYDVFLRNKKIRDLFLEKEMYKALAEKQFLVYLQPKYDINNNCLVGAESLVRWLHPIEGLIMPSDFIPLFEKNGFIINLDEYMWEETCKILSRWQETGLYHIPISVNVSRVNVHNVNFVSTILSLLDKYNVNPILLELELTETAYANQTKVLFDMLEKLRRKGVHLSMDDFGTGYSSLTMLKEAPINTIKLDKAFTEDIAINTQSETIVRHLIALAKDLDMLVLAEGVEYKEQADKLRELGCDLAQGYYYKVPLTVAEFEKLIYNQRI